MSHPIPSTVRADDLLRHLQDVRSGTYEGAMSRSRRRIRLCKEWMQGIFKHFTGKTLA